MLRTCHTQKCLQHGTDRFRDFSIVRRADGHILPQHRVAPVMFGVSVKYATTSAVFAAGAVRGPATAAVALNVSVIGPFTTGFTPQCAARTAVADRLPTPGR